MHTLDLVTVDFATNKINRNGQYTFQMQISLRQGRRGLPFMSLDFLQ